MLSETSDNDTLCVTKETGTERERSGGRGGSKGLKLSWASQHGAMQAKKKEVKSVYLSAF
jgi:hypothetical protein